MKIMDGYDSAQLTMFENLKVGDKVFVYDISSTARKEKEKNIYERTVLKNGSKLITVENIYRGKTIQFSKEDVYGHYYLNEHGDYINFGLFLSREDIFEYEERKQLVRKLNTFAWSELTINDLRCVDKLLMRYENE